MCGIHLPTTGTHACHLHRPKLLIEYSTRSCSGLFFFLQWGPPFFFNGRLVSVYKSERKEALWLWRARRRHRQKERTQKRARVEIRREPSDFYPFHSTSSSLLSLRNIVLKGKIIRNIGRDEGNRRSSRFYDGRIVHGLLLFQRTPCFRFDFLKQGIFVEERWRILEGVVFY